MKNVPCGTERVVVSFSELGLPEIPMVGRYTYTHAHPPLRPHIHRDTFEVCVLQRGTQTYVVGPDRLDLAAGDMIITQPGAVHGTDVEPQNRGCLYWIQFLRPTRRQTFLGLSSRDADTLFDQLRHLKGNLFHTCDLLIPTFERILATHADPANPLRKASVQNLLLRLILDILDLTKHAAQHPCSPCVRRALRHLAEHCAGRLSLSALAALSGISESYFKVLFKREVGMTPLEHLLWCRVERAKRLLRETDTPVTAVAFGLGFATSQHFATVFKRLTGHTPREFRLLRHVRPPAAIPPVEGTGPAFHPVATAPASDQV